MKIAYYPGCSLHSTAREYDASFRAVCELLDIELVEPKDWICCGTTPAHSSDHLLSVAMPLESVRQAEEEGFDKIVVPCASCFQRLKTAVHEVTEDPELLETVNKVLEGPFKNTVKVIHPLEMFLERDIKRNIEYLKKEHALSKLPVACYYGCLLVRPPKVMRLDQHEYPVKMDEVLALAGIKTVDWRAKTSCCGASFSLTETDLVHELTNKIFDEAKTAGAKAISVACPLCHSNLDTRQREIEKKFETEYNLPILYFTQLLGLAMGISPEKLEIKRHLTSTESIFQAPPELPAETA